MVTVTMDQIMDFRNAGDIFAGTKLPLKSAYKLNKLKKAIDENGEFYAEKLQEIINTYAKKNEDGSYETDKDGDRILIQEDKVDECEAALVELSKLTVEIDNQNLTIDDFGDNIECDPAQLEALMPFLS